MLVMPPRLSACWAAIAQHPKRHSTCKLRYVHILPFSTFTLSIILSFLNIHSAKFHPLRTTHTKQPFYHHAGNSKQSTKAFPIWPCLRNVNFHLLAHCTCAGYYLRTAISHITIRFMESELLFERSKSLEHNVSVVT
jgi:hypothetical protein